MPKIPPRYKLIHGDCIEHMPTMKENSIDFSVFSPPFPLLFAYNPSLRDLGNSENLVNGEAKLHFSFFFNQLVRVIKPGRIAIVHCMNIPYLKRTGKEGIFDFRGLLIRIAQRAGFIYEYDWAITKNPQSQAIRTHTHQLQFSSLEKDQSRVRGALSDYLIKLKKPGENKVPVKNDGTVSRDDWISWAEGTWDWKTIKETATLNTKEAKSEEDTRHICPMQLQVIDRLVKLYTNPRDLVFSPFAGIGSEGYVSLGLKRRFYGVELKSEYFEKMKQNLDKLKNQEYTIDRHKACLTDGIETKAKPKKKRPTETDGRKVPKKKNVKKKAKKLSSRQLST